MFTESLKSYLKQGLLYASHLLSTTLRNITLRNTTLSHSTQHYTTLHDITLPVLTTLYFSKTHAAAMSNWLALYVYFYKLYNVVIEGAKSVGSCWIFGSCFCLMPFEPFQQPKTIKVFSYWLLVKDKYCWMLFVLVLFFIFHCNGVLKHSYNSFYFVNMCILFE